MVVVDCCSRRYALATRAHIEARIFKPNTVVIFTRIHSFTLGSSFTTLQAPELRRQRLPQHWPHIVVAWPNRLVLGFRHARRGSHWWLPQDVDPECAQRVPPRVVLYE